MGFLRQATQEENLYREQHEVLAGARLPPEPEAQLRGDQDHRGQAQHGAGGRQGLVLQQVSLSAVQQCSTDKEKITGRNRSWCRKSASLLDNYLLKMYQTNTVQKNLLLYTVFSSG
jgi:hypothetical protein